MTSLPLDRLCQASRVFLEKAYPDGFGSAPAWKQDRFSRVVRREHFDELLPPSPLSHGFCQWSRNAESLAFRLGSERFPHLKLCVARLEFDHQPLWIFSVDTHDRMLRLCSDSLMLDADAWIALQASNRQLKETIEHEWESLGIPTHLSLLRRQLDAQASIA